MDAVFASKTHWIAAFEIFARVYIGRTEPTLRGSRVRLRVDAGARKV